MSSIDIYDLFYSIKKLVEDCEEAIKEGKLALSTSNLDSAARFLTLTNRIASSSKTTLLAAKNIITESREETRLVKYVSVYYRALVLMSIPYLQLILRDMSKLLNEHGQGDKAVEASRLLEFFNETLNTLRS